MCYQRKFRTASGKTFTFPCWAKMLHSLMMMKIGRVISVSISLPNQCLILVSRMNSDVEIVQSVLSTGFSNLMKNTIVIIAVIVLLLSISASLTGIVVLGVLLVMVAGTIFAIVMSTLGKKI